MDARGRPISGVRQTRLVANLDAKSRDTRSTFRDWITLASRIYSLQYAFLVRQPCSHYDWPCRVSGMVYGGLGTRS